jgi:hypothetical protein
MTASRKLAAIIAADVVGHSRLAGAENWLKAMLIKVLTAVISGTMTKERAIELLNEIAEGGPDDALRSVAFGGRRDDEDDED